MKSSICFTVPGTPVPQGSMTHVGNGRMIHKADLITWRHKIGAAAIKAALEDGWDWIDEPVHVKATFYLLPPKRPRWPVPAVKPDLDKLCRAIGDALSPKNGRGLLREDSRIVHWDAAKNYAKPGQERAVIEIVRLS